MARLPSTNRDDKEYMIGWMKVVPMEVVLQDGTRKRMTKVGSMAKLCTVVFPQNEEPIPADLVWLRVWPTL